LQSVIPACLPDRQACRESLTPSVPLKLRGIKGGYSRHSCFVVFLFLTFHFLFPASLFAEGQTDITSDNLEYLSRTKTYIAKGSVLLTLEDATLKADEMRLDNNTSDAIATGNVIYEDHESVMTADKMELNLKTKLGTVYNGYIFYKSQNFHIRSENIKKVGDKSFYFNKATFTSCDGEIPSWHIEGENIETTQHESLSSWHTKLYIRNTPVFYTPYFWTPIIKDRLTGLLMPSFGYSSNNGQYYKQGFFWAIKENQDATLYLDYYSEKKLAEGLDYRYILDPETNGELWIYHARDNEPSRDLLEIKSYHNLQLQYNTSAYLKVHAVNEFDYYEALDSTSYKRFGLSSWESNSYGFGSNERLKKYLESDLHLSKLFNGGRTYFLAQARQSLEGGSGEIPQSLPEIGFIVNTFSWGPFSLNAAAKGVNFWRKDGQDGLRFDLNPNFYFSYGKLINITQKVGLRETAYFLDSPAVNQYRSLLDLSTTLSTKLFRKYPSFVHIIEPSLEYAYIPQHETDNIPFFDSTDSIQHTSSFTYSLTNRISGLSTPKLETRFRLSQSYSLLDAAKPFSPVLAEAAISSGNVNFNINASYDVHEGAIAETISSFTLRDEKGYISFGKNFRRSSSLNQIVLEGGLNDPISINRKTIPLNMSAKLWYDLNGNGVQEFSLKTVYTFQCWGLTASFTKMPSEYQIMFAVELKGLGTIELGKL
jgi:LPS-assembly protein